MYYKPTNGYFTVYHADGTFYYTADTVMEAKKEIAECSG